MHPHECDGNRGSVAAVTKPARFNQPQHQSSYYSEPHIHPRLIRPRAASLQRPTPTGTGVQNASPASEPPHRSRRPAASWRRAELRRAHPADAGASQRRLAGECSANGGSFNESNDLGIHTYSCSKSNCDGKGGTCSVNCGDTGCTGVTPALIGQGNIRVILQNGSLVDHSYAPDEGSATPNHPATPDAPAPGAPIL